MKKKDLIRKFLSTAKLAVDNSGKPKLAIGANLHFMGINYRIVDSKEIEPGYFKVDLKPVSYCEFEAVDWIMDLDKEIYNAVLKPKEI
jgi:hypothetical protein